MVTFRNNIRRNNFRRGERNYKSGSDRSKFGSNFSNGDNFQRKAPGRNNHNASKLIEKYSNLAREALSNGDKILSENYLQHADHFTRILNEKENVRKEKFIQNRSEENISSGEGNVNNSEQIQEQDIVETSNEDTKIEKSEKSQVEIN